MGDSEFFLAMNGITNDGDTYTYDPEHEKRTNQMTTQKTTAELIAKLRQEAAFAKEDIFKYSDPKAIKSINEVIEFYTQTADRLAELEAENKRLSNEKSEGMCAIALDKIRKEIAKGYRFNDATAFGQGQQAGANLVCEHVTRWIEEVLQPKDVTND